MTLMTLLTGGGGGMEGKKRGVGDEGGRVRRQGTRSEDTET
jgi:hypothetical protein